MKVRNSFVTNSSSSSYCISAKKDKRKNMIDFFDIVKSMNGYETGYPVFISSEKDLNKYVENEYDMTLPKLLESDDYYKEKYSEILQEIKKGNVVLMQEISYGDEELYEKILQYVVKDYKIINS